MRRTQLLGLSLNGSLDLGGSLLRCGSLDLLGLLAGALLRLLAAVLNGGSLNLCLDNGLLVCVTTAADHRNRCQHNYERQNLFHRFKFKMKHLSNGAKICNRTEYAKEKFTFFTFPTDYFTRSATDNSSFLRKAFGKTPRTRPMRMMASSAVTQSPAVTVK